MKITRRQIRRLLEATLHEVAGESVDFDDRIEELVDANDKEFLRRLHDVIYAGKRMSNSAIGLFSDLLAKLDTSLELPADAQNKLRSTSKKQYPNGEA